MKGVEWYQDKSARKEEIIRISKDLIQRKIDFLFGIRELSELYNAIDSEYDCTPKLFSTFIALDEKTFHLPSRGCKKNFSNDFLRKCEIEKLEFEKEFRNLVNNKCEKLIEHFEKYT